MKDIEDTVKEMLRREITELTFLRRVPWSDGDRRSGFVTATVRIQLADPTVIVESTGR